jgi:hypothetical protein
MKKIIILISFILCAVCAFAQFPVQQPVYNRFTQAGTQGAYAADSGFVYRFNFPDTATANRGFLKNVAGLSVRINDTIYIRNNATTAWIRLGPANTAAAVTWNAIGNPTADQALTFDAGESSTWTNSNTAEDLLTVNTSTLTTGSLVSLNSTSTALSAGNNLVELVMSGANGTNAVTANPLRVAVTNTNGTSGTNKAISASASGATTANWALYTEDGAGIVGINGAAYSSTYALNIKGTSDGGASQGGIKYTSNNGTVNWIMGYGELQSSSSFAVRAAAGNVSLITTAASLNINSANSVNVIATATSVGPSFTPTSTLHAGGSFATAYVAKTGTYTATISDCTIECTANTFTVTLPTAVGITGRYYHIVNSGAGTITIATTSSQTFVNVIATPTTLTMAAVGTNTVQSNGTNWMLISNR